MNLDKLLRTLTAIAALAFVAALFSSYYRSFRQLPSARMETFTPLSESEIRLNVQVLPAPLAYPQVVIRKSRRRLYLYDGRKLLRVFPVALGSNPDVDKEREGDGATPIGSFYICSHNPDSRYYRFLGLSYPNDEDASRGLRDGLITREQARDIVAAVQQRARPDWRTPLGGEVGIHGGGVGRDWTQGCMAVSDEHIKELYDVVGEGTPVTIEP